MANILDEVGEGLYNVDQESEHPDDKGKLSPGPGRESFKLAQYWKSEINGYDQAVKRWVKRGNNIIKRFRDERNRIDEQGQRRMNLLWSNIKVMKPAIYSTCPTPIVDRKFLDRDPIGRLSSQILERTLRNELGPSGFHPAMNMTVMDRLLPGKGVAWARYVPKVGKGVSIPAPTQNGAEDALWKIGKEFNDESEEDESKKEKSLDETGEQVLSESVEVDYVDWRDFGCLPVKSRTWRETQAIFKKVSISKKEAIERFGEKIGKSLKPDTEPTLLGNTERQSTDVTVFQDINARNITIFEIWNKSDLKVYWISPGYDYLCDIQEDPLELVNFFPVPPPLMSTVTNDTQIPVPDFIEWQDQAIQIDELTQRIAMLTKACKVAGVYNAAAQGISRIFDESIENQLIPVDQWAMFADAGGLKGVIDFIPIDVIQTVIETLLKVRQQAMIDLDQVTGLSDVIRGTSDSRETLGGLRLKNNNAGTRLSESQEDVARFARDLINIMAEIACKHFSDETLIESSGILYEDALQPDVVMREFISSQQGQSNPGTSSPQTPQQPQPQAPAAQAPSQGPPSGPPPQGAPQGAPQPGQSNIVPFPAQGAKPPTGAPGAPMQPGAGPMPPQPMPDVQTLIMMKVIKAIDLLRKDVTRGYRIDIETDSTIFGDKEQDKENATEFLTAVGGYMQQIEKLVNMPQAMPLFAKALQWGVRKLRTGRDLEAEVDTFCEEMTKLSKQLIANPPKSPEQTKADAEVQSIQLEAQSQKANDDRAAQIQASNDQRDSQMQQQKNQMETNKAQLEAQLEQEKMNMQLEQMKMDMEMARQKHAMELQKMQMEMRVRTHEANIDAHGQQLDIQHKREELKVEKEKLGHEKEASKQEHQLKSKEIDQKHDLKMKEQKHKHTQQMKAKPKKKAS